MVHKMRNQPAHVELLKKAIETQSHEININNRMEDVFETTYNRTLSILSIEFRW